MVDQNRFTHLESATPLPAKLVSSLSRLNRFESLEVGTVKPTPRPILSSVHRVLCAHCGQANEAERDLCWACSKPTTSQTMRPTPDQNIAVMLNGVTYHSNDPNLPVEIQELMKRIRAEGYSKELLADWQRTNLLTPPAPRQVEAFQGQRVSVLRIDGVLYTSDDPNLAPEIREIFLYIEKEGLTPALLQHLRLYGTTVKYRPISTPAPSDGDENFWDTARKSFKSL